MRYLKLFESFENIDEICKKYRIKNYTINQDGSIDVDGNVWLYEKKLTKLPLKFNKVTGNFICSNNKLKSLEGSPIEINGSFYCDDNKLTSFEFAPKIIRGNFYCGSNNIKTFEYFPSFVKGGFYCGGNLIYEVWSVEFGRTIRVTRGGNLIYEVWYLFEDTSKIELLNDFDIFRDEDTDEPAIIMDRLNDFLLTIGEDPVKKVDRYKNI